MRLRAVLISFAMANVAALGTAAGAGAATLYTNATHATQVAVGTTAAATITTPLIHTSATFAMNQCGNSTLGFTVSQNSGGTVTGTFTNGTMTNCSPLPSTGNFSTPWRLAITGPPTTTGGVTGWAARVDNVVMVVGGTTYAGSFTTGVTAHQTGAGGATCLSFNDAGRLTGPLSSDFRIDTNYCFSGTAASWSLT